MKVLIEAELEVNGVLDMDRLSKCIEDALDNYMFTNYGVAQYESHAIQVEVIDE
jgi:hypothetical protein